MRKSSNVTQAQIAKMLNLSTVTVSKALRDHPDISPETIKKIKQLANKLGYTPDLIARALSSRRSNIIGVVVPEIDHTFFSAVVNGISSVAKEFEYQIVLTVSQEDEKRELENLKTLIAMRVDGILISISQTTQNFEIFHTIKKRKIPLVFFDRNVPELGFSAVVVDDRGGAKQAVEYAIGQGYTKIAHFAGPQHLLIARERCAGYCDALKANGIEINPDWIVPCDLSEEGGYQGFKKLLQHPPLPEVIFGANDPIALGVYDAAKEAGLRIPEDLGVIGFSDNIISRYLSPPMTTVLQPAVEIGKTACRLLLEEIQSTEPCSTQLKVVPTQLIIRGSCLKLAQTKVESAMNMNRSVH